MLIENDGTTYASVILKQFKDQFEIVKQQQQDLTPEDYNKKFSTLKADNNKFYAGYFQRNLSSVQDYQMRAEHFLRVFLSQHPLGIPSNQLFQLLTQNINFDYTLFNCNSFEEYLVKYAESYADVMVKVKGCIVYPKQGYQKPLHQKSLSIPNQNTVLSAHTDSFITGVQQQVQQPTDSLTFHSNNSTNQNIINKEFFMIQEEESHLELDQNLKFIEELLKESEEHDQQKINDKYSHKIVPSFKLIIL